jgi:hypothetical protein
MINQNKVYANHKPIIFEEQGNRDCPWDATSDLRARVRSWTAFFNEGSLIWWDGTGSKTCSPGSAVQYIGPELRQYENVLQGYMSDISPDVTIEPNVPFLPANTVRSYCLRSSKGLYAYIRNSVSVTASTTNITANVTLAGKATASWYDTKTGTVIRTDALAAGANSLSAPAFVVDIAVKIIYNTSTGNISVPQLTPKIALASNERMSISVFSLDGKLLARKLMDRRSQTLSLTDIRGAASNLPNGMYAYSVTGKSRVDFGRFTK